MLRETKEDKAFKIMQVFEEFLYDKGVEIPNKDRDEYIADEGIEKAILFGSDYYTLEDEIKEIL